MVLKMHRGVRIIEIIFISILISVNSYSQVKLDSLLKVVDQTIIQEKEFTELKEQKITSLKSKLVSSTNSIDKLKVYKDLFTEYEAFICDSAVQYSRLSLDLSEKKHDSYWITESKLQLSKILNTSGMYPEAIDLLNTIDTNTITADQRISRINRYFLTYMEWAEYAEFNYAVRYRTLEEVYQQQLLSILKPGTYDHTIEYARYFIENTKEYQKAEDLLFTYLPKVQKDTRQYAIYTSIISLLYYRKDDIERHKEYLAISAIADIRAAIKENTSLRSLAVNVLNAGDVERANLYIKKSMDDANFYNARLRNIQISKVYPVFDKAYQLEREKQQRKLKIFLVVISILSVLLIITVVYIIRQLMKLSEARKLTMQVNEKLGENNISLAEANHIKEEYIGRFLNLCSLYITKMENFHLSLTKVAKNGNPAELTKMLKANHSIDSELKEFYNEFDNAFLKIFPHFIRQFNELLNEEDRIVPKFGEQLTTELRVYALIRLGIGDSAKIAEFLRYSITTIYNYRSKFRNKSKVGKEHFEEAVMMLG